MFHSDILFLETVWIRSVCKNYITDHYSTILTFNKFEVNNINIENKNIEHINFDELKQICKEKTWLDDIKFI